MPSEVPLLEIPGVMVTNARLIVGSKTFAIRNITSVDHRTKPSNRWAAALGLTACALLTVAVRSVGDATPVMWGLAGCVVCLVWLVVTAARYIVVLHTAGGEIAACESKDWDSVRDIVNAINDAMIMEARATEPDELLLAHS